MGGDPKTIADLEPLFGQVISNLLTVGAIIFFVMLLYGGFKYLTSNGDPKAIVDANSTLTHAVLGLVAALLSYTVLLLVEYVTGANVTEFSFSSSP